MQSNEHFCLIRDSNYGAFFSCRGDREHDL